MRAAEILGAACLSVDAEGRVTGANDRAERLLRRSTTTVGRPLEEVLPADLASEVRDSLGSAEVAPLSSAALGLWLHGDALPAEDGGRVVLLRDGTALRQAEAARDESQRLARALLVTIPDIIYVFDIAAGRNVWFNREIAEVTGYSAAEMRAMGNGLNALVHPEDLARWPAFVAERNQLPDGEFAAFEYRVRHRGGRWRWLSARETVFARDPSGRPTQAFGVAQDVTRQKEAEAMLAERAEHQARIAEALQRPILQPAAGASAEGGAGLRVHSAYHPASDEARVGGDFFDVVDLGGGRTALVVGDVMGKGLEAATSTAQAKFMLRTLLLEGHAPVAALARLNEYLYRDGSAGTEEPPFVAVAVAVVDVTEGTAAFAVAGAEAPLVVRRDGAVEAVRAGGLPIGVLPDWEQGDDVGPVALSPGDLVALYTDGLSEARAPGGATFGSGRVENALAEAALLPSPANVGRALVERVLAWSEGVRHDDTCLLVARLGPPPGASRSSVVIRRT